MQQKAGGTGNQSGLKAEGVNKTFFPGGLDHGDFLPDHRFGVKQIDPDLFQVDGMFAHTVEQALVADHRRVEALLKGGGIANFISSDHLPQAMLDLADLGQVRQFGVWRQIIFWRIHRRFIRRHGWAGQANAQ